MACDEAVIKKLGNGLKKNYSASLLALATGRRLVSGTPLAFGEGDTKARIKNVLNYKKPAFWVAALALVVMVCIGVGLMANPVAARASMQWAKGLEAKDIEKIELVVRPSKEGEAYRLLEQQEFEEVVSLVKQSRGRYMKAPEPIAGGSLCLYITDKKGVRHWVCNSGNTYLIIDGDFYKAGYDWLSSWKYTGGNAPLPVDFDFENEKPVLPLDGWLIDPLGTYQWQESREPSKPSVTLKENHQFHFSYSVLSSYYAVGTYEINDNKLILRTKDGKFTYTFEIKKDTLIFNQEESSGLPSYANLPDGAVFSRN